MKFGSGTWNVEMMDGRKEFVRGHQEDFDRGVLDVLDDKNHRTVISVHRTKGMNFVPDEED